MYDNEFAYDKLSFFISLEETVFDGKSNSNLVYARSSNQYSKGWYKLANTSYTSEAYVSYYPDKNTVKVDINPVSFMNNGNSFRKHLRDEEFYQMIQYLAKKLKIPPGLIANAKVSRIDVKKDFYSPYNFERIRSLMPISQPALSTYYCGNTSYFYDYNKRALSESDFNLAIYGKKDEANYKMPEIVLSLGYVDAIRMEFRLQKPDFIANNFKIRKLTDCIDPIVYTRILQEADRVVRKIICKATYAPIWKAHDTPNNFNRTLHSDLEYQLITESGGVEGAITYLEKSGRIKNRDSLKYYKKGLGEVFVEYSAIDQFSLKNQKSFIRKLSFLPKESSCKKGPWII